MTTFNHEISLETAKGYKTEKNLRKRLADLGLDNWTSTNGKGYEMKCRYIVCLKPDGTWTAIFLVSEFMNQCGGYVGFASQHGFMSV